MAATKTATKQAASDTVKKPPQSARKAAATPPTKAKSKAGAAERPADAIKLLKADHKEVKTWFKH
jgi:hypothetical protein